jgi:hypothetical protein
MTNARPLRPGVRVIAHGRLYQISAVGDLETVLAVEIEHQTRHVLRIQELERLVSADACAEMPPSDRQRSAERHSSPVRVLPASTSTESEDWDSCGAMVVPRLIRAVHSSSVARASSSIAVTAYRSITKNEIS